MNIAQALHTAARRYCDEQYQYWVAQYAELTHKREECRNQNYSLEARRIFPRYTVLNAIGTELERLNPAELHNLDDTRDYILLAGTEANDEFTRQSAGPVAAATMANEREAFCAFIRELSETQLQSVQPLPYKRVLSSTESASVWVKIRDRWQITDDYWFPLCECALPDIAAFQDHDFDEFCATFSLIDQLAAHGINRIWELREYGPEYEQDVSLFDPHYNGAEGYWSSSELDWIVYASHEGSVTVGGWLLAAIKAQWPDWEKGTTDIPNPKPQPLSATPQNNRQSQPE